MPIWRAAKRTKAKIRISVIGHFSRFTDFRHLDEFDAVLVEGVERGFFDEPAVKRQADEQQNKLLRGDKSNAFEQAWQLFHGSFDDNQDAVLDALAESVRINFDVITPINLSATISFLKEFGRESQANEALKFYIDNRQEEAQFWNLAAYSLHGRVTDPDVKSAFDHKFNTLRPTPQPEEILKRIGQHSSWNPEDLTLLAGVATDEYFRIFKGPIGEDREIALRGALMFRDISSPDEHMRAVTQRVEGALRLIAAESPMNDKRVRNYGVDMDETNAAAHIDPALESPAQTPAER